jgi:hypothetical protein
MKVQSNAYEVKLRYVSFCIRNRVFLALCSEGDSICATALRDEARTENSHCRQGGDVMGDCWLGLRQHPGET